MPTEPENMVLALLRRVDTKLDAITVEMRESQSRLALVDRSITLVGQRIDIQTEHTSRLDVRLDRIEARLGLVEA